MRAPSRRDPKNWLLFATSGHFGAEVRISGFQESAETAVRRKKKRRRQIAGAFELMLFLSSRPIRIPALSPNQMSIGLA
jgi:hypothetical protein